MRCAAAQLSSAQLLPCEAVACVHFSALHCMWPCTRTYQSRAESRVEDCTVHTARCVNNNNERTHSEAEAEVEAEASRQTNGTERTHAVCCAALHVCAVQRVCGECSRRALFLLVSSPLVSLSSLFLRVASCTTLER